MELYSFKCEKRDGYYNSTTKQKFKNISETDGLPQRKNNNMWLPLTYIS